MEAKTTKKESGRSGHKSKREKEQIELIDLKLASGELKLTPGVLKYNQKLIYVHAFWRIFYVTVYYYLAPFSTIVMSTYSVFF